jgi:hypothetical protein
MTGHRPVLVVIGAPQRNGRQLVAQTPGFGALNFQRQPSLQRA